MQPLKIDRVESKSDFKSFIELQWRLYKGDQFWIPPLLVELKNRARRGLEKEGNAVLFLARRGTEVVGRISASLCKQNFEINKEGNFGFYECVDDMEVARCLMGKAIEWLKNKGATKVVGPYSFLLEDPHPGFLVDGFDRPPYFMMAYTKQYYLEQMRELGFEKAMDLNAYELDRETALPEGIVAKSKEAESIPCMKIRNINLKKVYEEAEIIRGIFNEALKNNWGSVPFSSAHARRMAKDLKFLADPRIILIAEIDNRPVGAVINLPNYNELLKDCNGRLFPKGIFRILFKKKSIKSLRGYALAVLPEYQRSGLGCLLTRKSFEAGIKANYEHAEVTWILESNKAMDDLAQFMGGHNKKVYRLFKYEI